MALSAREQALQKLAVFTGEPLDLWQAAADSIKKFTSARSFCVIRSRVTMYRHLSRLI